MEETTTKKSSLIRAAMEALSKGNYAEAILCSKHALKQDRRSYDALIVLGKALFFSKQLDQAEIPYKRAAELNPDDVRAWRGLIELYEAIGNYKNVVEACDSVIHLYQAKGNQTHLNDYRRRLAVAYAALGEYKKALKSWESFLEDPSLSATLYLEALCGIVDAKAAIMEDSIQELCNILLIEDNSLDKSFARRNAENEWLCKEENIKMEETLLEILERKPCSEKYETLLLQLLVWRMRTYSSSKGEGWHDLCKQVLTLCLSSLQWHATNGALVLLLALCEEDGVDDFFNDMGMIELGHGRADRFRSLGKRLLHAYPDQDLVISILVFIMHQSSSCPVSLVSQRSLCECSLRSNENSIIGWQVLAELRLLEGAHSSASECIKRGLQVINTFRSSYGLTLVCAELRLRMILGDSLLKSGNYEEASSIFQNIEETLQGSNDMEASRILVSAMEGQVKALLSRRYFEEASATLVSLLNLDNKNSWALAEQGWIAYQKRDFGQAINLLERALNLDPESACYHYRLGLSYLSSNISGGYGDKSLTHLLESARLDSSQPEVFRVLGDYYKNLPNGAKRAVRCYQKAVLLNCEDEEAGEALCALLDDGGQVLLELTTCREASQKSPRSFWAFRRLGYLQIDRKQWSDAAKNLQHAVRGYPNCADVWEALALAYQQLGMLTAALKAYDRAINLQHNPIFALQQSGNVLLTLGLYRKAVSMFRTALEKSPEHPASMYGLASALLGQASECRSMGAIRWSASLLKEAIVVASCSVKKCRNLGSFWKLLGDIQMSYARNLPWQHFADMSNRESSSRSEVGQGNAQFLEMFDASVKAWNKDRIMAARKARQAYQHALHLQPHKGNLYSDLCLCLDMIDNVDKKSQSICTEAVALCGLALEGENADLWTTLGVTARDKGIRQHALIQALHVNGDHAHAWAELGQMYLKAGEQELAKEAFTRSRSVDPSLSFTWAAMANMCDSRRQDQMQEAYANILYAAQLLPIVDFQLGLAKTAMTTHQLDSEQVYAAIDQAVLQAPERPEVHNLKGLLCELRGEYTSAILAFQTSRAALESNVVLLSPHSVNVKRCAITINLARCLCKAGDANSAVEEYESECLVESGNIEDSSILRGYATALWQQRKQKRAMVILKRSIEIAEKKSMEHSAAIQLLAKFTYFMRGPAMSLEELYCGGIDMHSVTGLARTAWAIASAAGRHDILLRIMSEGSVCFHHDQAVEFVCLAVASIELSKDGQSNIDLRDSILLLQKTIHMHPQSLLARLKLMQILLDRSHGFEIGLAARCCSLANFSNLHKASDINGFPQICGATALACSVCGGIKPQCSFSSCKSSTYSCIRELQRWLHLEPWNLMTHYQLVLNLMQQAQEQKFPVNTCLMLQRMAEIVLSRMMLNDNTTGEIQEYMQLQLMLCCSEVALRSGRGEVAVETATAAISLRLPADLCLLPHLQLVRCHAVNQNKDLLNEALTRICDLDTLDLPIWVCILNILSTFRKDDAKSFMSCIEIPQYRHIPDALLEWKKAEKYIQDGNLSLAEKALNAEKVTMCPEMAALHLFHGAICIELVKSGCNANLSLGSRRLMRIASDAVCKLPIAGLLLAQAHPAKVGTPGWQRLIRTEWSLWPQEFTPAELYFQMGLLTKISGVSNLNPTQISDTQSPRIWFRKAVHINPSCAHYWTMVTQTGTNNHTMIQS